MAYPVSGVYGVGRNVTYTKCGIRHIIHQISCIFRVQSFGLLDDRWRWRRRPKTLALRAYPAQIEQYQPDNSHDAKCRPSVSRAGLCESNKAGREHFKLDEHTLGEWYCLSRGYSYKHDIRNWNGIFRRCSTRRKLLQASQHFNSPRRGVSIICRSQCGVTWSFASEDCASPIETGI